MQTKLRADEAGCTLRYGNLCAIYEIYIYMTIARDKPKNK